MTLNQTSEHLSQTVKSLDEAQLLAFFAANFTKLEASCLESDIPQLMDVPQQVKLKCQVDVTSLNKFIEDLQGINLEVAALDGEITQSSHSGLQHQVMSGPNYAKQTTSHSRHQNQRLHPHFPQESRVLSTNQFSSWNSSAENNGKPSPPHAYNVSKQPYPSFDN